MSGWDEFTAARPNIARVYPLTEQREMFPQVIGHFS
jgi:hypothetical protein